MSCSQAVILLVFNTRQQLSYMELLSITGLSDNELKRQIVSLTMNEHQVLIIKQSSTQPLL